MTQLDDQTALASIHSLEEMVSPNSFSQSDSF